MKMCRSLSLIILLVAYGRFSQAQFAQSNPVALHASLVEFEKQKAEWKQDLLAIKIEELPITYAEGRIIQRYIDTTLQILLKASEAGDYALSSQRLVAVVIVGFSLLDLQHGLLKVSDLLDQVDLQNEKLSKKRDAWSTSLNNVANGPLDALYMSTAKYVYSKTDEMEKSCTK